MSGSDLYDLLGVPPDADAVAIRRAYQRLARRLHPHLRRGDREARLRFETILTAYSVLADPGRRRRYDQGEFAAPSERADPWHLAAPALGEAAARVARGAAGGASAAPSAAREAPADLWTEVVLDFAEALHGVTSSLSVQREVVCPSCEALAGAIASCPECGGRGVVVQLQRIRVRVPAGVSSGTRLRLAGRGNRLPGADRPGDLHLLVGVRPHPYFRRRGADVHAILPVSLLEAVFGAEVEVPTVDGRVRVALPPATPGGQRFRLRGRGAPRPDGTRGDHYYTVQIVPPRADDPALRQRLADLGPADPRRDLPRDPL